ncbi:MBL fold metallo-hydrolase [Roseateles sp. BYS180W]|uniref:MBL fold metallo-hydrolase n=1 Tax=Roseateles rivi TaxID=3299028 RepID=A0ABW7FWW3_9BURK
MTNAHESQLHFPLGDALPGNATTLELRPGLRWVRMQLPFVLNHINLWLLRDELDGRQGWTVVDCGLNNEATVQAWEQIFATELDGLPVLRVLVTHFHPDHMGLAHWLTEHWSTPTTPCRLWMSAADYYLARLASGSTVGMGGASATDFFISHGLSDPQTQAYVRARSDYYPSMVPVVPASFQRLMDGQCVRIGGMDWRCIAGHGHAPEHISLHCPEAGLLISGDMVLPRISTNVSVVDIEPDADPLRQYLDSLRRFEGLPEDTLVLPAHGRPFQGLATRLTQLHEHHAERFELVLQACAQRPQHAADLLPQLFTRALDMHQATFAMGEAIAHLHALWHQGRLQRQLGADGVYRFSAVAA